MPEDLIKFKNKEYWDEKLQDYVDGKVSWLGDQIDIWRYFKHCLRTQNRFFFKNPLVPLIVEKFEANAFVLNADTALYRARIDKEWEFYKQCILAQERIDLLNTKFTEEELSSKAIVNGIKAYNDKRITEIESDSQYLALCERRKTGFEGYDLEGSGAPPYDKAESGRCNPENVVFLYAANDAHTAVAEIRPFIRDSVSVATLKVKRNLKLVDFYYKIDKNGVFRIDDNVFFMMRTEYSLLNKGNKNNYLVTQFLSLLAQDAGFDGIRFRSSLVEEGTNYVIFNPSDCEPVSSKVYVIPRVKYDLVPALNE